MSRGGDRDFLKMAYRALDAFDDQGRPDMASFDDLIEIALRDGIFDGDEKRVMREVIARVDLSAISPDKQARLREIQDKYEL